MIIPSDTFWVFDLDDTLYKERDYQLSGFDAVANLVQKTFHVDVVDVIQSAQRGNCNVLDSVCSFLDAPSSVKESLLWCYRLHTPNICLDIAARDALDYVGLHSSGISILTDGRAFSQRSKVNALGLQDYSLYISEEWGETKPAPGRFQAIMDANPNICSFVYVGDNIKKDFVTPNQMGWVTIGLKDNGRNIHPQHLHNIEPHFLPTVWVDSLEEIKSFIC
ncbi:2-haloalkanoic acid dehalogenase [Photobacterium rosenbergii]|uniref:2-haloalkanoic acid dehalogenase n=1 Tax=Photobacterium rosenbergii TaxID=294936 RepID=A0A2T3NBL7_9GAMM|nr:HAD family hydrolase [Photobacterium rosenbergii]PSW11202.1 2-haloalkanoic acid dehalogenase [Photobacterium rosenbergii]